MVKLKDPKKFYDLMAIDPDWYLKPIEFDIGVAKKPRFLNFKEENIPGLESFNPISSSSFSAPKPKYLDNTQVTNTLPKLKSNSKDELKDDNEAINTRQTAGNNENSLHLHQSSTIQSAIYWEEKQLLHVSFKSGSSYTYNGVPPEVIDQFEGASSHGSYFYYNIRMSYSYHKV